MKKDTFQCDDCYFIDSFIYDGKLTIKKLILWCNIQFSELLMDEYEVFDIYRTRYTSSQYESGAAKLVVKFRHRKVKSLTGQFYCFYSMKEYNEFLSNGYKLAIARTRAKSYLVENLEIQVEFKNRVYYKKRKHATKS